MPNSTPPSPASHVAHVDPSYRLAQPSNPWWQRIGVKLTVALLGLLVILGVMNYTILNYEQHLATGDTVLLELAPVDPRGFMQGDYMALRYALEDEVLEMLSQDNPFNKEPDNHSAMYSEGYVVVSKDTHNVGHLVRLESKDKTTPLADNQIRIHYRLRSGQIKFATNAFFFQEGHAEAYEAAEYGLFKVNKDGEPLLTKMVDENFVVIEPKE